MKKTRLFIISSIILYSSSASAFKIGSSVSAFCHEQITMKGAFCKTSACDEQVILPTEEDGISYELEKLDPVLLGMANYFEEHMGIRFKNDFQRFVATNLLIGARYPDQGAFSITDINDIRTLHLAANGQEAHALRYEGDDDNEGAKRSIARTKAYILKKVKEARSSFRNSIRNNQITKATIAAESMEKSFFLEFYGIITIDVWKPIFLLGEAIHAFQDSYTHSIRSNDGAKIYEVLNFVEAISGELEEGPDGSAHSDALDNCLDPEVEELFRYAISGSRDIFFAIQSYFGTCGKENDSIEATAALNYIAYRLDIHMAYEEDCGYKENYCGSKWAYVAKKNETGPLLGCQSIPVSLLILTILTSILWFIRKRRGPA